ncbi:hypothetical protein DEO72_LG3g1338 [Vigna unguiculata]|uniref:Uncharacterized protein n=1 Tax=Vigna unguiculata TaxID=3917 RepID=A0A4D6LDX4_VIGUN|nr:hypothetical protein DEO72_LG3g1338 [Vigna unguiculata]
MVAGGMPDGFFKVLVKEPRRSYFHNDDGSMKFPFNWTDNPWCYKDMKRKELSVVDREVVETLMKFNDKGLSHMAQLGKKNLNLFQALCKEKAAKAKSAGNTKVPNLQDLLVKVHVHGGTTRKVEVPAKQGGRKDVNRVRATLLGSGSSSKVKKPEPSLIELPETTVQCDIEINLAESLVNSIDNIEPNAMVKDVLEFNNKALILGHRLGSLLQREMKEGGWSNVEELREELKIQADKHTEEKATWKKEKEEWLEERKRLGELEDLKGHIIQKHINGFQKGLWQAAFFHKDVDAFDAKFDVNKDVVDGQLVNEMESILEEEAQKVATEVDANPDEIAVVDVDVN